MFVGPSCRTKTCCEQPQPQMDLFDWPVHTPTHRDKVIDILSQYDSKATSCRDRLTNCSSFTQCHIAFYLAKRTQLGTSLCFVALQQRCHNNGVLRDHNAASLYVLCVVGAAGVVWQLLKVKASRQICHIHMQSI